MANHAIAVPYLAYDDIGVRANGIIREHHPSRELPIPVEDIIDTGLHIDIFPLPGLTRASVVEEGDGIVAYVNSALNCITVDDDAWGAKTRRYRFSIAHELAHIVVHGDILRQFNYATVSQWKEAMKAIPTEQYGRLEWQANAFAGHLLVPTQELRAHLQDCLDRMHGWSIDLRDEETRSVIERYLADVFHASSQVVHIRIDKEELWPQEGPARR
ncbi:MAG TPA: ImmA/IrrE family metallo-endopeptidase [Phycisphaerae bacterium]|nr:ImmA/IrrE family metallo-endopeptidase [Phycisphaerae bacterium]